MVIKINYTSSDVYVSTSVSPVYVVVNYSGTSGGGGAVWGGITGTLSDQTDLQDALDDKVPYTGATTNVDLGEFGLTAGQLTLDVSPTGTAAVGTTRWNDTIGSSETTLKGGSVILKNGVDLVARVVNKVTPNTTLTKAAYQAVKVSGAQGQRLAIALAQANNDANSADTIGLVTETIATNQEGFIMTVGNLEGINTTGSLQGETWADGDVLYLSPTTAGALTNIKPTGATGHIVVIGYVEYAHANNGKIYVKIMNGWELDELHNVYISSVANNDALIYESSTSLWKNKTIATALGYTPVPTTRTLTINGTAYDLSADRSWTVSGTNIYTADGTLAGNRVVTMGGNTLTFDGGIFIKYNAQSRLFSTYYPTGSDGQNIFIGGGGLNSTTGGGASSLGSYNISIGVNALQSNTTGKENSAVGTNSLQLNTSGSNNSAVGVNALQSNTSGVSNAAFGHSSLIRNTTGSQNSAVGVNALYSNTTGTQNSAFGGSALNNNIGGSYNSAFGYISLQANTSGTYNSTLGGESLYSNTTGTQNSALGFGAMTLNSSGSYNSSVGVNSLYRNTIGNYNSALGFRAGTGSSGSTFFNTTGTNNIFIGYESVGESSTESNRTWIGNSSTTSTWVGGNLLVGTRTDAGYKLDVNGTARVSGDARINNLTIGLGSGQISTNVVFAYYDSFINNSSGANNVILGYRSAIQNTSGSHNSVIGSLALYNNTSGGNNIAIGQNAMFGNTTSGDNIAIGRNALAGGNGGANIGIGYLSLQNNNTGSINIAIGGEALNRNTTGGNNTAIGNNASYFNTTGGNNTAFGVQSLYANTTGSDNVAFGYLAGRYISGGSIENTISSSSIFIGNLTKALADNQTNQIVIGYNETGLGSNTTIIGNSSTTLTALRGSLISGGTSVNASAQVQVDSTTKGFLPPRGTNAQMLAIASPATGLMFYDTTNNKLNCYDGTTWQACW